MILIVEQQTVPNTGNFILLVLAVCGAVADNRYKAKGGKRTQKGAVLKLAVVVSVILALFWIRGASADSLIYLGVTFFVLGFAGYDYGDGSFAGRIRCRSGSDDNRYTTNGPSTILT